MSTMDADEPDQSRPNPPVTGESEVDRALESLQDLDSQPLNDHHDRLARAHEELHRALNSEQQD